MASTARKQASPLSAEQARQVEQLARSLDRDQLSWVSGYLAGVRDAAGAWPAAQTEAASERSRVTILYGSETGNAERVALQVAEAAAARGLEARAVDMAEYKARELREERLVLIVTATHGEGAPPDPAADFYEFLHGRKAPKLPETRFAVLALGDSSYEFFCQTGRDFDARLEALGGQRLIDRVECDVDFEEAAEQWLGKALDACAEAAGPASAPAASANVIAFSAQPVAAAAPTYDRANPFEAEVLENLVLNGRGSERETRHIELSLEGSGLDYAPGDVLCLAPRNREESVAELLQALELSPEQRVAVGNVERPLAEALLTEYEITTVTPGFVRAWAERAGDQTLLALTAEEARAELMAFMAERWVIDVVSDHPAKGVDAPTLLGMLRRLQAREYSIASSFAACPDEVHMTVAAVRYATRGRERHGVASTWLADRVEPGDRVGVYLRRNKHFRLPADPDTRIIMVGPGTGVAPFRAFMQEREVAGAAGASWLFFGNPHFRTDFLYQTEWQKWLEEGVLNRLDVAFSRDQAHKVYVQHRLLENGAEVYRWLEEGAHLYVCGDAERMAPDVNAALIGIVREHGGRSNEQAAEYVKQLQRDKRYQRDVY